MSIAEKCLLVAVRDRLRSECDYTNPQCDIEFDAMAPATVGDVYVAVLPGGWVPGPRQNTSGGVSDRVYSVEACVIKRIRAVPRDRQRDVFLSNLDSLDEELDKIHEAIDWQYAVNTLANAALTERGQVHGFIEPLRFSGVDKKPRLAPPELFGAAGTQTAGMMRTIYFGGARRINLVTR